VLRRYTGSSVDHLNDQTKAKFFFLGWSKIVKSEVKLGTHGKVQFVGATYSTLAKRGLFIHPKSWQSCVLCAQVKTVFCSRFFLPTFFNTSSRPKFIPDFVLVCVLCCRKFKSQSHFSVFLKFNLAKQNKIFFVVKSNVCS
jgi:hypothetical protein